jgi:hypothetical protein
MPAIASGMFSQNCHCHDRNRTSTAPYSGPHTQPNVSIAPSVPRARARPRSEYTSPTTASATGTIAPPPRAVSTRPTRNGPSDDVSGMTIEPARNNAYAPRKVRRRPITSLSRPAIGITAMYAMR